MASSSTTPRTVHTSGRQDVTPPSEVSQTISDASGSGTIRQGWFESHRLRSCPGLRQACAQTILSAEEQGAAIPAKWKALQTELTVGTPHGAQCLLQDLTRALERDSFPVAPREPRCPGARCVSCHPEGERPVPASFRVPVLRDDAWHWEEAGQLFFSHSSVLLRRFKDASPVKLVTVEESTQNKVSAHGNAAGSSVDEGNAVIQPRWWTYALVYRALGCRFLEDHLVERVVFPTTSVTHNEDGDATLLTECARQCIATMLRSRHHELFVGGAREPLRYVADTTEVHVGAGRVEVVQTLVSREGNLLAAGHAVTWFAPAFWEPMTRKLYLDK